MLLRQHTTDDMCSEAAYSDCMRYRYKLTRRWDAGQSVNFIMLNPSTADELRNDPTVERCEGRARMLGFGGFAVTNIFAWRATDPFEMRRATHPDGPENDAILTETAAQADMVIVAWGVHGGHRDRGQSVAQALRDAGISLFHLGLSKDGHPRHPLYLPYARQPVLWETF